MFNFLSFFKTKKENTMFAVKETNGRFFIVNSRTGFSATGTSSYGRARDAKRGAARAGLTLA